jgi:thiol-disulfide isomerase/thioredoxin
VAAIVLATAFGLYRAARDGRFRGTHDVRGATASATGRDATPRNSNPGPPSTDSQASTEATTSTQATTDTQPSVLDGAGIEHQLGDRATLLQFSSAFCAPCRATRRVLADVAGVVPGVVHVEVDAEHHLELVRRLGILRTPTTLVLDPQGREISRASGAPRKEDVLATLGNTIDS